ncbi:MAG: lipopolysaccharide biosynthesis protein [Lachnospiraceae bacterium]|nr:lipopolysaccharide biosynthesis protein [Lachnospiraceae bacterium]
MEETSGRSVRANMLFNTAGSVIYYFCIWITTILIVRMSGYEDAGILSIAMTVTASPAIAGLFNVRSYQVSDLNGEYADRAYIRSRIFTNLLSLVICVILAGVYGYFREPYKLGVILAYMILKMSEAGADVYYGIYQKKARLDYAGISLVVRGIGALATFILLIHFTKDLLLAVLGMSLFSVAVVLLFDMRIAGKLTDQRREPKDTGFPVIMKLIIRCIPLAIVSFLNNLSLTVPRTYLEKFHGEEIMGYYASVSSPTIVIQLAATTLFAPLVPIMTMYFLKKEKKSFLKAFGLFAGLMGGLTAVAILLSVFLADPVLKLVFGPEIGPYTNLFIPILISAALIAVNASLFSVCTLMRIIRPQYLVGIIGIVTAVFCAFTVVKTMDMNGVLIALFVTLLSQIAIQATLIVASLRRMKE